MGLVLPRKPQEVKPGGRKSGSLLGGLGGLAVGLGAAAASGGIGAAALPGILGATTTGANLGGAVGEAVSPAQVAQDNPMMIQEPEGAALRRMREIEQSPVHQLFDARRALAEMPIGMQKEYAPILDQAIEAAQGKRFA